MRISIPQIALIFIASSLPGAELDNPRIDIQGYFAVAQEAARHREGHRVSEAEFLRLGALPGAVILDARSQQKFDLLHIKGAINLSFPDIDIESLERTLPDKDTLILIYCNNNFADAPRAFPAKMAKASLNISTYIALYTYGYRNVYELAPLVNAATTPLPLVGSAE